MNLSRNQPFVYWLSLAQLISWGSLFYNLSVMMTPLEQAFGFTRAQSAMGFSLAMLVEGLLAFPVGRLIDQGRERLVMMTGSILAGIFLIGHAFITGLISYYLIWIGLGAAMSCCLYAPAFAVLTRRFPMDFRKAIITLTFLGGLASTVFIPLMSALLTHLGWRMSFVVLALIHLLICLPIHAIILRKAPPPVVVTASAKEHSLQQLIFSKPFILLAIFTVVMMGITAALPLHIVSLLRERGLSETWVIAVPASIGILQVFGRLILYFFEARMNLHMVNRLIPCFLPIAVIILLIGGINIWAAFAFVLFYGIGNGMLTIVKGTAIALYVNRQHVGALNGVMGFPLAIARAVTPLILGLLWAPDIGYRNGLILVIALSIIAIAALMAAQRHAIRPDES